jgi:hypothetical protein
MRLTLIDSETDNNIRMPVVDLPIRICSLVARLSAKPELPRRLTGARPMSTQYVDGDALSRRRGAIILQLILTSPHTRTSAVSPSRLK